MKRKSGLQSSCRCALISHTSTRLWYHGAGSENPGMGGSSTNGLLFAASPSTQEPEERGSGELDLHTTDTATLLWNRGPWFW